MEQVQIVTCDPDIKSVADLEGKTVSIGASGSGVYYNALDVLNAYGIGDLNEKGEFTKFNATYQDFGNSVERIPFVMRPKNTRPSRCCIYKDRAILRFQVMAALGFRLEEEEDDSTPLSVYAEKAL